jgi:hypothetical protein
MPKDLLVIFNNYQIFLVHFTWNVAIVLCDNFHLSSSYFRGKRRSMTGFLSCHEIWPEPENFGIRN